MVIIPRPDKTEGIKGSKSLTASLSSAGHHHSLEYTNSKIAMGIELRTNAQGTERKTGLHPLARFFAKRRQAFHIVR